MCILAFGDIVERLGYAYYPPSYYPIIQSWRALKDARANPEGPSIVRTYRNIVLEAFDGAAFLTVKGKRQSWSIVG